MSALDDLIANLSRWVADPEGEWEPYAVNLARLDRGEIGVLLAEIVRLRAENAVKDTRITWLLEGWKENADNLHRKGGDD